MGGAGASSAQATDWRRIWPQRLPIVIGVVGHRDIADPEKARAAFSEALAAWLDAFPHSPFLLLSALAEGADRLAVECALELMARRGCPGRIRIFCPLPMPEDEYREDWGRGTPADAEFLALCARLRREGHRVFALPLGKDEAEEQALRQRLRAEREEGRGWSQGSLRNARYALAGAYIARHAHILAAFWDGEDAPREGGTAWVVRDFLEGHALAEWRKRHTGAAYEDTIIPRFPFLSPEGFGAVWHCPCARRNSPDTGRGAPRWLLPEGARPRKPQGGPPAFLRDLEDFNRRAARIPEAERAEARRHLHLVADAPAEVREDARMQELQETFASADLLAGDFQAVEFRRFWIMAALLMLAVFSFKVMDFVEHLHALLSGVFSGLAALTIFLQWRFHRDRAHHRHLQYRALAEGMRVQMAWAAAGLQSCVCDHYPEKHLQHARWIWHALRGLHAGLVPGVRDALSPARLAHVRAHWIRDQRDYLRHKMHHRDAADGKHRRVRLRGLEPRTRLLGRLRFACLAVGGAGAVYAGLQPISAEFAFMPRLPALSEPVLLLVVVLPLALAVIVDRALHTLALEEELDWYAAMLRAWTTAEKRLSSLVADAGDGFTRREGAATLLLALGRMALHENIVWLDIHRKTNIFDTWNLED